MKLNSLASFTIGPNSIEKKRLNKERRIYSFEDMRDDLGSGINSPSILDSHFDNKFLLNAGDIVINLMTNMASIVTLKSEGKMMNQSMMKIKVDPKEIDPWYLCFLLNESDDIKKQERERMEGTVVKRITAKLIKDLEIKLLEINVQRRIGSIYRKALLNKNLILKKARNSYNATIQVLQDIEEDNRRK